MDNPHELMSWPDFEAAARKADALWSNLNLNERQAIKDNAPFTVDYAIQIMQKALQNICNSVQVWEAKPQTPRGTLIEFKYIAGGGYIFNCGSDVQTLSGSIITDIILAFADYHEKHKGL